MKSVKRWFPLSVIAAALLALAVPAVSSAAKLENSKGELVPAGTPAVMWGTELALTGNFLGYRCERLTLKLKVTKNNGSSIEGAGNNLNPGQSGCKLSPGAFYIPSFNLSDFAISNPGSGTVNMNFVTELSEHSGNQFTCTWSGTAVPFSYVNGTNVISFTTGNNAIKATPAACGHAGFDGSFSLTEENGQPLVIK